MAEDGDEITIERTDPDEVSVAQTGRELEAIADDLEGHQSWVRMSIDAEERTVSHGELRLNVSDSGGSKGEVDSHANFEYETGIDVDRPDELGSPTVGELLWRLFAY